MIRSEAARLLAAASAFDNRDPNSEAAATAWATALADIPLDEDALAAVARFYSQPEASGEIGGRRWLEPHQFRTVRARIRAERTRNDVLVDDGNPDESPREFLARRRAAERAHGDGQLAGVTPLRALGPGANGPDIRTAHFGERDVAAMRRQGDLAEWMRIQRTQGLQQRDERRARILRHPDLAAKLCEPPLSLKHPEQWEGAIPPETWNGVRNDSPLRPFLLALVAEAERRERAA